MRNKVIMAMLRTLILLFLSMRVVWGTLSDGRGFIKTRDRRSCAYGLPLINRNIDQETRAATGACCLNATVVQPNATSVTPITAGAVNAAVHLSSERHIWIFRRLSEKLKSGTQARVMVAGGSFTKGFGCTKTEQPMFGDGQTPCAEAKTWAEQVIELLRETYCSARSCSYVESEFYGLGSTTTHYGYKLLRDAIEKHDKAIPEGKNHFDLVIFDYACNDNQSTDSKSLQLALELSIRLCIRRGIGFVVLRSCPGIKYDSTQHAYAEVANYYSLPLVSYSDGVFGPNAISRPANNEAYELWDGKDLDFPHPGCRAQRYVAELLFGVLQDLMIRASLSTTSSRLVPPPPSFGASVNDSILIRPNEACFPALVDLTVFDESKVQFSAYRSDKIDRNYLSGWNHHRDRPGKPPGWIAGSSESVSADLRSKQRAKKKRSHFVSSSSANAWIAFEVILVQGIITITYLETYNNAGVIECWISARPFHFDANGGIKISPTLENETYKTKNFNKGNGPIMSGPVSLKATKSVLVDTFNPNRTTSELRQRTISFDAHGIHLLNMRHVTLPQANIDARGGDKVKVVGIRSC